MKYLKNKIALLSLVFSLATIGMSVTVASAATEKSGYDRTCSSSCYNYWIYDNSASSKYRNGRHPHRSSVTVGNETAYSGNGPSDYTEVGYWAYAYKHRGFGQSYSCSYDNNGCDGIGTHNTWSN